MASRFQPVIRKARFVVSGFSTSEMLHFGDSLAADVKDRILRAEDAYDQPAPPLAADKVSTNKDGSQRTKKGYQSIKAKKHPPAIRNWQYTGRTLRGLRTLEVGPNKVKVGFSDPEAAKRAAINNRRSRQFGASPKNMEAIRRVIATARFVRARPQAA